MPEAYPIRIVSVPATITSALRENPQPASAPGNTENRHGTQHELPRVVAPNSYK